MRVNTELFQNYQKNKTENILSVLQSYRNNEAIKGPLAEITKQTLLFYSAQGNRFNSM